MDNYIRNVCIGWRLHLFSLSDQLSFLLIKLQLLLLCLRL